jgi:F0F1-type ATP synthase membrane subunit a
MTLELLQSIYASPTTVSVVLNAILFCVLGIVFKYFRDLKITILFELIYEKMYDFFVDILGKDSKLWLKTYVLSLFFIILFFNLQSVSVEFLAPIV